MSGEQQNEIGTESSTDPVDQTLVAYLDGELSDVETEKVEADLMQDPQLRDRLQALQSTWDLLDELPVIEPGPQFLKSTIELAVSSSRNKKARWHRWPIRFGALALAFGLTSFGAYKVTQYVQGAPYREFIENVDFLQNYSMYQQVQDIEFLEALDQEVEFLHSQKPNELSFFEIDNKVRLSQMTETEVREIVRDEKEFAARTESDKGRLVQLHEQLEKHWNREKLLNVMRLYCQWHAGFSSEEKYGWSSLPVNQRVAAVMSAREKEVGNRKFGEGSLSEEDGKLLNEWRKQFCDSKRLEIGEMYLDVMGQSQSSRMLLNNVRVNSSMLYSLLRSKAQDKALGLIDEEQIKRLRGVLSKQSVGHLDDVTAKCETQSERIEEQRQLIDRWLEAATQAVIDPFVDRSVLIEFYELHMTKAEKEALDGLSSEDVYEAIRKNYIGHVQRQAVEDGTIPFLRNNNSGIQGSQESRETPSSSRNRSSRNRKSDPKH